MLVNGKCVTVGHCLVALCDAVVCAILFEKESSIEAKKFGQQTFRIENCNSRSTRTTQERKLAENLHSF